MRFYYTSIHVIDVCLTTRVDLRGLESIARLINRKNRYVDQGNEKEGIFSQDVDTYEIFYKCFTAFNNQCFLIVFN